jgi:CubicO group peptidase (beta-lactamase class C family)
MIQELLNKAVEDGVFPGCTACVYKNGELTYYVAGNKENIPVEIKNTLETSYDIASLSKVVSTSMVAMQLIEKGLLSYTTTVKSVLPEFRYEDITIRHVMTHTTGLPADHQWKLGSTKEEIIHDCLTFDLVAPTGTKVIYSDVGYILLGLVIEKICGKPLDVVANKMVFDPLGMTNTSYQANMDTVCATEVNPFFLNRLMKGEVHDRKANMMGGVAGHAGVFSNIEDMAKYMMMLVDQKEIILKKHQFTDLYTTITPDGEISRGIAYLTKDLESPFSELNSEKSILHTGFTGTSIMVDFEKKVGCVLLSNRIHPTRENKKIIEWRRTFHDCVMKL